MKSTGPGTRVLVIALFDRIIPSAVMGIRDLISLGNMASHWNPVADRTTQGPRDEIRIMLASPGGKPVIDGHGRTLDADADFQAIDTCSAIIVPGFMPVADGEPARHDLSPEVREWFRQQHQHGAIIGSSCSGAFVVGEAGLLNGRRCTTTWWLHDKLEQDFPKADVAWGCSLIEDDRLVTASGPLSWVDLTLHIIAKLLGEEHAKFISDFSVIDTNPKQQDMYMPAGYLLSKDEFVLQAEHLIRENRTKITSAESLAQTLAMSPRTLHRRLKKVTGETPKQLIDRVKLDQASVLLLTSDQSVKKIALSLGYSDESVFGRVFKNHFSVSPSQFRDQSKQ